MAPRNEYTSLEVNTKIKFKTNMMLIGAVHDMYVFADVISVGDPIYRGSDYWVGHWVGMVLERLALKKSSNVKIFKEIKKALKNKVEARDMEVKEFTLEQLRPK